jgi:ribosomal protein L11 methyltransferase
MQYIEVNFDILTAETTELMIALLSDAGFEGFAEEGSQLTAYIPEEQLDQALLQQLAADHNLSFTTSVIPPQNWNAQWEANFQPVVVADFCTVRADFHHMDVNTPYEIVITPKMSFGTGHHATTQLMMTEMRNIDFKGKKVLDFGTGTGILAILAEMLGATEIIAIDNDEWSYDNAIENLQRNNSKNISIHQDSLEITSGQHFDVILANINRHILLQYMTDMYDRLNDDGRILMSGLLSEDREIIVSAATVAGFRLLHGNSLNNWITLLFEKNVNL